MHLPLRGFLKFWAAWTSTWKRLELSQATIDKDGRLRGVVESGIFTSMLGADFAGTLHSRYFGFARSSSAATGDGSSPRLSSKVAASCVAARSATAAAACLVATVPASDAALSTAS